MPRILTRQQESAYYTNQLVESSPSEVPMGVIRNILIWSVASIPLFSQPAGSLLHAYRQPPIAPPDEELANGNVRTPDLQQRHARTELSYQQFQSLHLELAGCAGHAAPAAGIRNGAEQPRNPRRQKQRRREPPQFRIAGDRYHRR